eukprot:11213627-Lingulodinium_polyedra.AAC.1
MRERAVCEPLRRQNFDSTAPLSQIARLRTTCTEQFCRAWSMRAGGSCAVATAKCRFGCGHVQ